MGVVQKLVDSMVRSRKLLVVTNTVPLYLLISMFFSHEQILENETDGITKKVFTVISQHLATIKSTYSTLKQPLLYFYQLRNLIQTYTTMLKYFLCFQTPLKEKTSSSELYS